MGKFYVPELVTIRKTPVIVYPCESIEGLIAPTSEALTAHLERLHKNRGLRVPASFNIEILWKHQGDLMTDVWMYSQPDSWGSGSLVDERTFRGYVRETKLGISAEYGLIALGLEANHRLFVTKSLREYLKTRPVLPEGITNKRKFFTH